MIELNPLLHRGDLMAIPVRRFENAFGSPARRSCQPVAAALLLALSACNAEEPTTKENGSAQRGDDDDDDDDDDAVNADKKDAGAASVRDAGKAPASGGMMRADAGLVDAS